MKARVKLVSWLPCFDAFTWGHTILVKKEFAEDTALILHEEKHVEQIEREWAAWVWYLKYLNPFTRKYRMAFEAEAYAVSVANGHDLDNCAAWMSKWFYFMFISKARARAEIEKYL